MTILTTLTTLTMLTDLKNYQVDECRIRIYYFVLFFLFCFGNWDRTPLYRVGGQGKSNQEACLETNSDNKQKQLRFDQDMSSVSDEVIQGAGG